MTQEERELLQDLLATCIEESRETEEVLKDTQVSHAHGKAWGKRAAYDFIASELQKIIKPKK